MHAITKRLEICIDINIEIRKVDYYSWIFTSRQSRKHNKRGSPNKSRGVGKLFEKKAGGRLLGARE